MPREREHTGVLSRAVRVDGREPHAAGGVVLGDALGERGVWTAQQIALGALDLGEEVADDRHLPRLARMRRAAQRELLGREPEPVDRPVRHQRQRLEWLRRRSPVSGEVGISDLGDEPPRPINDGDVEVVPGFHHSAAQLLNSHSIASFPTLKRGLGGALC